MTWALQGQYSFAHMASYLPPPLPEFHRWDKNTSILFDPDSICPPISTCDVTLNNFCGWLETVPYLCRNARRRSMAALHMTQFCKSKGETVFTEAKTLCPCSEVPHMMVKWWKRYKIRLRVGSSRWYCNQRPKLCTMSFHLVKCLHEESCSKIRKQKEVKE